MQTLQSRIVKFFITVTLVAAHLPLLAQWNIVGGINADPNIRPGAASFNGKEYIFFRKTTDRNIGYITTSNVNGGSFSGVTTLSTVANNPEPGAVVFNNRLFVFYAEGSSPSRLWFRHIGTTGGWSPEFIVPGASTNDRPGLAVFNGKLYIIWETAGGNNNIRYASLMVGGAISPVSIIPQAKTRRAPTAAVFNNRLYVVFSGESGSRPKLWYTSMASSGVWASQNRVGGSPRTSAPPTAIAHNGELHVYYAGASTYRLLRKRLSAFGSWSGEQWIAGLGAFGGATANHFGSRLWITIPQNTGAQPRSIGWRVF